jgi:hypothetical protein
MIQTTPIFFIVFFNVVDPITISPGWFNCLSGYTQLASKQKRFQNNRKQLLLQSSQISVANNQRGNSKNTQKLQSWLKK